MARAALLHCFSAQLDNFDYFTAEKQQNMGNYVYDYLIKKIRLLSIQNSIFAVVWPTEVLATLMGSAIIVLYVT